MFLHLLYSAVTQFYTLAPSGRQLEEIGRAAKKVVPYVDDVARAAVKNRSSLASIPVWVWVIVGIVVIAGRYTISLRSVESMELFVLTKKGRKENPRTRRRMECEGLCNMGSYLIYSTSISHFADFCIKNLKESQDSIYGDGFRYVLGKYEA